MTLEHIIENLADASFLRAWSKAMEKAQIARMRHNCRNREMRCIYCNEGADEIAYRSRGLGESCPKYVGPESSPEEDALTKSLFGWIKDDKYELPV